MSHLFQLGETCVSPFSIPGSNTGSRSKLKKPADQQDAKPIYVNEDLTAYRAKLAFNARQLKTKGRVADTSTFNGKIVVKDKRNNMREIASAECHSCGILLLVLYTVTT